MSGRSAMRPAPARTAALSSGDLAWAAALPCALATVAGIVLLGPPLGEAFFGPGSVRFWPAAEVTPEPTEHARYAIALLGPALLAGVVLAGARRRIAVHPSTARLMIAASHVATLGLLVLCMLAQHDLLLRAFVPGRTLPDRLFTPATLATAAALTALGLLAVRRRQVVEAIAAIARESRGRRIACALLALAATALWLSTAIDTDATIGHSQLENLIPWDMSETFAVLDGRTPLVDFHAQYAQLLPYLSAAIMAGLGAPTLGAWTAIMSVLNGLALLAVYAVLRRLVRSSALALALYLPFLATSLFVIWEPYGAFDRGSPAAIFSAWPMRYAGPYLLLWLTARHLDERAPRRTWLLLLVAGLVTLNNVEFGAAAFLATLAALACHRPPRSWRALARVGGHALLGLGGAALLVTLGTLVRAGALPDLSQLLEFPRLYGVGGWVLLPMTPLGFHVAMYLTFAAAIVVAIARTTAGREPLLTGLLAWSGVFGLIVGGYFAGRSDYLNLITLFSSWCLALVLLVVVVARALLRSVRRPTLPEVAVVFGFGLAACSLAQIPAPWTQLERLDDPAPRARYAQPSAKRFVARTAMRGERVAILIPLGHRIAYDLGLTNVSPYSGIEAMPTPQQLQRAIDVIHAERVTKVYVSSSFMLQEQVDAMAAAGFAVADQMTDSAGVEYFQLAEASALGG